MVPFPILQHSSKGLSRNSNFLISILTSAAHVKESSNFAFIRDPLGSEDAKSHSSRGVNKGVLFCQHRKVTIVKMIHNLSSTTLCILSSTFLPLWSDDGTWSKGIIRLFLIVRILLSGNTYQTPTLISYFFFKTAFLLLCTGTWVMYTSNNRD